MRGDRFSARPRTLPLALSSTTLGSFLAAADHSFSWNGVATDGTQYSSGTYTLTVQALDADGNSIGSSTKALGKVTGVDSSSGSVELMIGSQSIDLSDVLSINA